MINNRIKECRKAAQITQKELSAIVGKGESTISEWEAGKRSPDIELLPVIAEALHTTPAYLMGWDQEPNELDKAVLNVYPDWHPSKGYLPSIDEKPNMDEVIFLRKYLALDNWGRGAVKKTLDYELERKQMQQELDEETRTMLDMMVYTFPAAAGIPLYAEDDFEHIEFPADQVSKGADFGIRISGDSMEPTIHDGDIVWIRKTSELQNGQIGVFMVDDSSVCKRFQKHGNQISLISDNERYEPIEIKEYQRFGIVGKVLGYR